MYELTTELAADKGGFFVGEPRLIVRGWRSNRRSIYNANYAANGDRFLDLEKPWNVLSPIDFQSFRSHEEAALFAFKGMTK